MRRTSFHLLGMILLFLGLASVLFPEPASALTTVICATGTAGLNYQPGLQLLQSPPTNVVGVAVYGPCVTVPPIPGLEWALLTFEVDGNLSCAGGSASGIFHFFWNDGTFTDMEGSILTTVRAGAVFVTLTLGNGTPGSTRFAGSTGVGSFVIPGTKFLDCLMPAGVRFTSGPSTATIIAP